MIKLARVSAQPAREIFPGVGLDGISGERVTLIRTVCAAGVSVPAHRHAAEQVVLMLEGTLNLSVAGQEIILRPGDLCVIPSMAEHSGHSETGAVYVEAFAPARPELVNP